MSSDTGWIAGAKRERPIRERKRIKKTFGLPSNTKLSVPLVAFIRTNTVLLGTHREKERENNPLYEIVVHTYTYVYR